MGRPTVAKWIKEMLPKKCMNCGSEKDLVYHHIVPVSVGGNDIPSNIAVLCVSCHGRLHYGKDGVMVHGDQVKEGMKRAKARGVQFGPKTGIKAKKDHEKVMRLIAENSTQFNPESMTTEPEIMEMAGVKPVCYHECKRELLAAMELPEWPYEWEKPVKYLDHPLYEHYLLRVRAERGA